MNPIISFYIKKQSNGFHKVYKVTQKDYNARLKQYRTVKKQLVARDLTLSDAENFVFLKERNK
jgi:hypothetical protein